MARIPSDASTQQTSLTTPTLKVVLLGDLGVGKTCLRSQFVHHIFTNAYKATIGGDYLTTTIQLPPKTDETTPSDETSSMNEPLERVNLQIWDTAGQERFNSKSQAFYRGTDVCVLCYDITNYESVLSLKDWFDQFMQHCHVSHPGVIIVGNKTDRGRDRVVDKEEIEDIITNTASETNIGDYVYDWKSDLIEVSAKQLQAVEALFIRVGELGKTILLGADYERQKLQDFDNIELREMNKDPKRCAC